MHCWSKVWSLDDAIISTLGHTDKVVKWCCLCCMPVVVKVLWNSKCVLSPNVCLWQPSNRDSHVTIFISIIVFKTVKFEHYWQLWKRRWSRHYQLHLVSQLHQEDMEEESNLLYAHAYSGLGTAVKPNGTVERHCHAVSVPTNKLVL